MGYNVTFDGFAPAPRFPPILDPWTRVEIEESADRTGPWTTIDTFDLDPVDVDPTTPQARRFSTENATLASGWYRIAFLDDAGDSSFTESLRYPASGDPRAQIARRCAASREPKLTGDDLDELVQIAQRRDSAGLSPNDPAWVPTYDLNAAAAEGWRWKAAKAVGLSASSPGEEPRFDFTQRECLAMAEGYASRKAAGSIRVLTTNGDPDMPSSP